MKNKFKPFLLWGGVFLLISFVCFFLPFLQDVSVVWINVLFWIVVSALFIFPQTGRAESICKKFPNLSLYFLYSGWAIYLLLPLGLILCKVDTDILSPYGLLIQIYTWLCLSGVMFSYLAATLKIVYTHQKTKPFLLFGGLYQIGTYFLTFFPNSEAKDKLILGINIFALCVLLFLFIFPQTDRTERICKKIPNLSLYFLYSGWVPYMLIPLYFIPLAEEIFVSEIMVEILKIYVVFYGLGMYLSLIVATVVIAFRCLRKK